MKRCLPLALLSAAVAMMFSATAAHAQYRHRPVHRVVHHRVVAVHRPGGVRHTWRRASSYNHHVAVRVRHDWRRATHHH